MYAVVLAATVESFCNSISSSKIVNVAAVAAPLVTAMLVTTVVVAEGVVYRVVLDVAAAPRKSTLEVVAISYYLS
jgi:multisubunit Na+/H+ antiporter MnhC subunit